MFNFSSSLYFGSTSWDTNYARMFLQISDYQHEKINKIPGWSKTEISENIGTGNVKASENIEKQSTQQASTSAENFQNNIKKYISAKDNGLKTQNLNSDLQLKQKHIVPSTEKEIFLRNLSLSPRKKKCTSSFSLQRSSSLPDLLSIEELSDAKFDEIYRKREHSTEKGILTFKLSPLLTKGRLNETYTVPITSNDGIKLDKLLKIKDHKSFSCPLEHPNRLSKQKFEPLDDCILNHKYLKSSDKAVIGALSSKETIKTTLKQEMSVSEEKLLLLEKRLSQSKEMGATPFIAKLINVENLNCEKNLKSSHRFAPADEVVAAVLRSDSTENVDEVQNSSLSKSHKSLQSQSNSQSIKEKYDASENAFESIEDSTGNVSKITACNFESFLSPPVPCGQLPSTEIPYLSESIPSQKSAKLDTPTKSQYATPSVPSEQLLPEAPTVSQPVLSQKLAKANTVSESQNAELSSKFMVPENPSGAFSVCSANSNEKVSDLASSKELGTKRKRKNRSEKSSKKLDAKKLKITDIQFSSAQIRNMIEIMKLFHTEF